MGNSLHCNQVLGLVNSVLVISGNYSLMIERHKESIKFIKFKSFLHFEKNFIYEFLYFILILNNTS